MKDRVLFDFHSHVLPCVDDGSRSADESLKMLEMLKTQGISTVVATPHFDADRVGVEAFVEQRDRALGKLNAHLSDGIPEIKLGAEVSYYPGVSRLDGLRGLCIDGTDLLLIEMPMCRWDRHVVDELVNLSATRGIIPVVAHVERCLQYQDKHCLEELCSADVLFQINASFVINISTRRKAIGLLKKRLVHLVGSDCHGTEVRPPRIGEAYRIISDKLGEEFVSDMSEYGESLFEKR